MAKVQQSDIQKFCELRMMGMTFAAIAKETGFSASTVSKYVKENQHLVEAPQESAPLIANFSEDELPPINWEPFAPWHENLGGCCVLTEEETQKIRALWKELRR